MSPKTSQHPDAIGNGDLNAVFTKSLIHAALTTNSEYCANISFSTAIPAGVEPDVSPHAATVAVTVTTGVITLAVKNHSTSAANADVSFTITPAAAKVDWSDGAASAYTLKDVLDLINEDDAGGTSGALLSGFKAWINDAPYDLIMSTASSFAAETAKYIQVPGTTGTPTHFLTRDLDVFQVNTNHEVAYKRLGLTESRDRGLLKFLDIWGSITGSTADSIEIYRDDVMDFVEPVGTYATDLAPRNAVRTGWRFAVSQPWHYPWLRAGPRACRGVAWPSGYAGSRTRHDCLER